LLWLINSSDIFFSFFVFKFTNTLAIYDYILKKKSFFKENTHFFANFAFILYYQSMNCFYFYITEWFL